MNKFSSQIILYKLFSINEMLITKSVLLYTHMIYVEFMALCIIFSIEVMSWVAIFLEV